MGLNTYERVLYYYDKNGYITNIEIEFLGYNHFQYLLFIQDDYVISNGRKITKERILFDLRNIVKYRTKNPLFNNIKGLSKEVINYLYNKFNINIYELKEVLLNE